MNPRLFAALILAPVATVASLSLAAQPPEDQDVPRFVVRISRPFLAQLTAKDFVRERPIDEYILGARVEGLAQIDGRFSMKLVQDQKVDGFTFLVKGQVASRSIGRRGPIAVHTQGEAQFDATRPVVFKGNEFVGQPVELTVEYDSQLGGVTSRRGGPFGRLAGMIAYPSVVKAMPESKRIAESKLRDRLEAAIKHESDELLVGLNRVTAAASILVLLQKARGASGGDLAIQMAACDDYLCLAIAPDQHPLKEMPLLSDDDRAQVEVWIRRLGKNKELDPLNALRLYWRALAPFLKGRLSQAAPEVTEALENIQITELADWRVVRFYVDPVKETVGAR